MRFPPLPGTKTEAQKIESLLRGQPIDLYSGDHATEVNLFSVKKPKILHIATHGFFLNDKTIPNPMLKSGIALSGANISAIYGKDQGIVTALKLSGLDLQGTDLVVLSACQTGEVDINSTESVSGLSKAFIQAGVKNLIISLWSVDDQATVALMTSFYSEAKKLHNFSQALKEAKLKMIHHNMHPFYWAAFILYGL
jgi:CHAT domain-containing protein